MHLCEHKYTVVGIIITQAQCVDTLHDNNYYQEQASVSPHVGMSENKMAAPMDVRTVLAMITR